MYIGTEAIPVGDPVQKPQCILPLKGGIRDTDGGWPPTDLGTRGSALLQIDLDIPAQLENRIAKNGFESPPVLMVTADTKINQDQGGNGEDGIEGIDLEHQPEAHQKTDQRDIPFRPEYRPV